MTIRNNHLSHIKLKGSFNIDCNRIIFSDEEIEILEKWGHWFEGLMSGELTPFTEAQVRFIKVINGESEPFSLEEKAYFKYLGRKSVEMKYGDRLKIRYEVTDDTFYSRDDKKKMNRLTYGTIAGIHRKGLSEK